MGYTMRQTGSDFHIPAEHVEGARAAILALLDDPGATYRWVERSCLEAAAGDAGALFRAWRWDVGGGADGAIDSIEFTGQKAGSDEALFGAIAPFVADGSYVEMEGEDGSAWRWCFEAGELETAHPTTIWGEPLLVVHDTGERVYTYLCSSERDALAVASRCMTGEGWGEEGGAAPTYEELDAYNLESGNSLDVRGVAVEDRASIHGGGTR